MKRIILVIGGCRSGKSGHALTLARSEAKGERIFMATCVPHDPEMDRRVARHQQERGSEWKTLDIPEELAEAIREHSTEDNLILVDCLTLWISNLLFKNEDEDYLMARAQDLCNALTDAPGTIILVSNEVGAGIVPGNHLARVFRDCAGGVNQAVAAVADRVIWTVAGIPVTIKPHHFA